VNTAPLLESKSTLDAREYVKRTALIRAAQQQGLGIA